MSSIASRLYKSCALCIKQGGCDIIKRANRLPQPSYVPVRLCHSGRWKSSQRIQDRWALPWLFGLSGITACLMYKYRESVGTLLGLPPPPVYAVSDIRGPRGFNFIADVVEQTSPAVVCITVTGMRMISGGSGFIIESDGLILTNAHVVRNNSSVQVMLQDGREFHGQVLATDNITDLALIRIQARDLPKLPLGVSGDLRQGEWVIAMGSPLSLKNTVTVGIVSSVHRGSRELGMHNKNMEYIQTDAVINNGNSGGPLVNLDGNVIGINTMTNSPGISFAIPSDKAKDFLERAEKYLSRVKSKTGSTRPTIKRYLGITMLTLTPSILQELRAVPGFPADVTKGILVTQMFHGSPAHKGGLMAGDIIEKINGKDISCIEELNKALESRVATLTLGARRKTATFTINVYPEDVTS